MPNVQFRIHLGVSQNRQRLETAPRYGLHAYSSSGYASLAQDPMMDPRPIPTCKL